MKTLAIDIETFSSEDIKTAGVYRYTEDPDFQIMLFGYSIDDGPRRIIDLMNGEEIPAEVIAALPDTNVTKQAFTAQFERTCLSRHLGIILPPVSWDCTMVRAARLGLPLSLAAVAKVLKLEVLKDSAGKALIRYFSCPCKPTAANGWRTRNLPVHDPERWQRFKSYCLRDVEVEQTIRHKIDSFQTTETENQLYILDQLINDRGILVDPVLVANAILIDLESREELTNEAIELTGLTNPNSAAQLKTWLSKEVNGTVATLRKGDIPELMLKANSQVGTRVLAIRQEMAKTSVKKFEAMHATVGKYSRIRGLYQFYGANRTGRWAGRLVQMQNLPQNHLSDLDLARRVVQSGDRELLQMLYGNVPDTLSQLIRTAFVAGPGKKFIAVDFAAIELIVLAWLSGEQWVIDEFIGKRKIYEQTAARMFRVAVETITKNSPERQRGKIASLACQYGGGVGALVSMGALRMGLNESELPTIIKQWRSANVNTVQYWSSVERAAIAAVKTGKPQSVRNILFTYERGILFIELPSGRRLAYVRPQIDTDVYMCNTRLTYEGMNQVTRKWERIETWGGKLVENIVQAVARDCLGVALLRLDHAGYFIVGHVHDEIIIEVEADSNCLAHILDLMTQPIPWAEGLPLAAEGFESPYYKK